MVVFDNIEAQLREWLEIFSANPDAFIAGMDFLTFLVFMFFLWSLAFDIIPAALRYLDQKALYYYCKRTGRTKWKSLGETFRGIKKACVKKKEDNSNGR